MINFWEKASSAMGILPKSVESKIFVAYILPLPLIIKFL